VSAKAVEIKFDSEEEALILQNETRSVKTSFSLRRSVDKRLRELATRMNVPMSSVVDRALELYMNAMDDRSKDE
jgi:hypothetical protein